MKKLLIILVVVGLTCLLWSRQHARARSILVENGRLATTLDQLEAKVREAELASQTARRRSEELEVEIASRKAVAAQAPVATNPPSHLPLAEPDSLHQGGWPADATYFYLPKQYLTNAQYKVIESGHLTDEAATLLGMSAPERSTVNQLFADMFSQFRQLELNNMKPVTPPQWWEGATFGAKVDSAVAYQIPALADEVETAHQLFSQQLQQTLGTSRAGLLAQGTDAYLRDHMDDLGAGERVIGFLTAIENDGSRALWYHIADARHGDGSFQRVPTDLAPDSQIAYYANLLGIKLPEKE